jgi:hypothetical protein
MVEELAAPSCEEGSRRYDVLPNESLVAEHKKLSVDEKTLAIEKESNIATDCQNLTTGHEENKQRCSTLAIEKDRDIDLALDAIGAQEKSDICDLGSARGQIERQGEEIKTIQERSVEDEDEDERAFIKGAETYLHNVYQEIINNNSTGQTYHTYMYHVYHLLLSTSQDPVLPTQSICRSQEEELRLFKGILGAIEGKKEIECATMLFLLKYKVIYFSLVGKLITSGSIRTSSIQRTLQALKDRGIIYEIGFGLKNEQHYFKERKSIITKTSHFIDANFRKEREIRWFGLTHIAAELLPFYRKQLKESVTEEVYERIKDNTFKTLYGPSHRRLTQECEYDLKKQNMQINAIAESLPAKLKFGKHFYDELNDRWIQSGKKEVKDRLKIANQMGKEAVEAMAK